MAETHAVAPTAVPVRGNAVGPLLLCTASIALLAIVAAPARGADHTISTAVTGGDGGNANGTSGGAGGAAGMGIGQGGNGGIGGTGTPGTLGQAGTNGTGGGRGGSRDGAIGGATGGGGSGGPVSSSGDTGGGGGGGGGSGLIYAGAQNITVTSTGSVWGGNGGTAFSGTGRLGGGGGGGDGMTLMTSNGSLIVVAAGATVMGGDGGSSSVFAGVGAGGGGGNGIWLQGNQSTILVEGTVAGGDGGLGDGPDGHAIVISGNTNRLELRAGAIITGNVVAIGNDNRLTLGGSTDASFDASALGTQYQGFELHKSGTSTWTVTGNGGTPGRVRIDAGTIRIEGIFSSDAVSVGAATGGAEMRVSGAGSIWNAGQIQVASNGAGTLTIDNGGKITSAEGIVGWNGTATAEVTGLGSTWEASGVLTVGHGGTGTLTIADGGHVTNTRGLVAAFAGSNGTVIVTGTGSTWRNSDNVAVGDRSVGNLTLTNGGSASVGNGTGTLFIGVNAGSDGTVNIGAAATDPAGVSGTLDAAGVQFGNGAATLNFNHTGTTTLAASLSSNGAGVHAITHRAGTTTLTGDGSAFTGITTVLGGKLVVNGGLGGTINIDSGGRLGGTGTLGASSSTVTVAAGGVHAPGNSIGVQIIAGNYVNHGTLQVEAEPTGADKLVVAGTVDIGGATLDLLLSPATASSWNVFNGPFTIIDKQSAGAVTGMFGSITQNLLFLDASLDYAGGDGNDVTLQLLRNDVEFADVGTTTNQIATGSAIDSLDNGSAVWRAIALAGDEDIVRKSFDALSGELHASLKSALIEDNRFVRDAMNDRLRSAFDSAGASYIPVLSYAAGETPLLVEPAHSGPTLWLDGFGAWGSIDGDGNAAGLERSTGGMLVGLDAPVGDWRIGLLAGYGQSAFSTASSSNYQFGIYGGTEWGDLALRGGLAYARHDIDTSRAVAIPGITDTLTASYGASTVQGFGELAYGIDVGATRISPFANLAYVNLSADGFTETGGDAALSGDAKTTVATFTTLGFRLEHGFTLGAIDGTFSGTLGWRHAFGGTTPESTHAFAGSDSFVIVGVPIAPDAAVIEAGLDLNLAPGASLGIAYSGQIAADARDHAIKASLDVAF